MAVPTQDNIFDLIMRIPIEWPFLEERIKFQTLSTLPSLYENVIRIDGLQQRVPIGCNLILGVEIEKHGSCSNLYKNSLELNVFPRSSAVGGDSLVPFTPNAPKHTHSSSSTHVTLVFFFFFFHLFLFCTRETQNTL